MSKTPKLAAAHCHVRLALLDGNQNSNAYIYPLPEFLLLAYHHRYGIKFTRKRQYSLVESHKDVPGRKPDSALSRGLNPIENIWGSLVGKVYEDGPD
ncbi:LOW QUALITY PROTEIN: hypothetical protein PHMEG_00015485 [Phytophthora megakarya]|uniref:Uncharacterized protein n=1 Tax=Phytophthora megakarya TaxID=4795 RepID=A0A225W259_9STRA|nr:LOW QUALITY PROTEIN: hypothetical protein PHMEG_00015485 [Phytophthora megakarya]